MKEDINYVIRNLYVVKKFGEYITFYSNKYLFDINGVMYKSQICSSSSSI